MTSPLTDRAALIRNRARALRDPALFLHQDCIAEIQERLGEINRRFTSLAVVTGFPALWGAAFSEARVVPDDDVLDLVPGAHDLVIHALSLHWANDPVGQLVQCRRALRPDGLFLGLLFGGQTLAELRAALAAAEAEVTGGLRPRILPMGEIRALGALLQRAGLALPVADSLTRTASYRNMDHLMHDLRAMGEGNALAARSRHMTGRRVMARAAEIYRERWGDAAGRIPATFEIICLTGWAPDTSQPQPLRPGSAARRLADALGAAETPLPATKRDG